MRHIYKDLREKFISSLRKDLIGPYEENEELYESPISSYIMGRLSSSSDSCIDEPLLIDVIDDNDKICMSKNRQSSAGVKAFVSEQTKSIIVIMKWADYNHSDVNGKQSYKRIQKKFEKDIDISTSNLNGIHIDRNIYLSWIVHKLNNNNKMISVYIENKN